MTEVIGERTVLARYWPTGVLLGRYEDHSPEWHAARRTRIGGSDVAAILGVSKWKSPYSLWHSKRNGWIDDSNPQQEWGKYAEPSLLAWYFDKHGTRIDPGGTFVHHARDYQLANPDAIGLDGNPTEPVIVEAKLDRRGDLWGTPGTDEVPIYYRPQVMWYMDALGIRRAVFVVSIGGAPPELYYVDYDPEEADRIRTTVEAFVDSLIADEEPDLDDQVATYETVQRLHPDIDRGAEVSLSNAVALGWLAAKKHLDAATAAELGARARLLDAMGRAQYATWLGEKVARRQARGGQLPYPVLTFKESK